MSLAGQRRQLLTCKTGATLVQAFVHSCEGLSLLGRNFPPPGNAIVRGKTEKIFNQSPKWKRNTWFHLESFYYPLYIQTCGYFTQVQRHVSGCVLPWGGGGQAVRLRILWALGGSSVAGNSTE